MAGEAVSRTSLSLAFQRKQNLEWRKLRERLHLQLQQDIERSETIPDFCNELFIFYMETQKDVNMLLQGLLCVLEIGCEDG
jgi:hypothetical protein